MLKVYSERCQYSRDTIPEYERLATVLKETPINVARLDCFLPDNREFCRRKLWNFQGFPVFEFYHDGYKIGESFPRGDERTAEKWLEFMDDKVDGGVKVDL
eukprot:TRINITY_DN7343_c0_g1_i1.p2 TRINITY_DN7343_c0_g1~~TRINITY_DN7343_c0_g1_i1.p2  ORF type:complete len:101 (-),score=16.55 TRINITY_DN7343_c0_g1_i1:175-477(-)